MAKPAKKPSLMDGLMDEVDAAPPVAKKSTKKDRPVITCETQEEIDALDAFTSSDSILKLADGSAGKARSHAYEVFTRKYLELCVQKGSKPANPLVQSSNGQSNFVVKHVKKFNRTGLDGKVLSVKEQMKEMGFNDEITDKVVAVVKERAIFGLKKFSDLTKEESTPKEKSLADKLMKLVKKNFTVEERKILLEKSIVTEVDATWQDTAVRLACSCFPEDNPERIKKAVGVLNKLFSVIPPQFVMSQVVFTGDLTKAFGNIVIKSQEDEKNATPKTVASPNGKYKAVIVGKRVTLYDGDKEVGQKVCTDSDHADNTVKKWFKVPEYLAEFLAECKK